MRLPVRIGLVTLALATTSLDAAAESSVCGSVKPGDTASGIARRLTGRADNRHEPWFRIIDPEDWRVVPKSAYDRILSGWQACIPATHFTAPVSAARSAGLSWLTPTPLPPATTGVSASPMVAASEWMMNALASELGVQVVFVILGLALSGTVVGAMRHSARRTFRIREALKREVRFFGQLFVNDFERPLLIQGMAARPIYARLRWVSHRRRLDILLAPSAGRRYPNLDDHRRNVEYDVERIANRLRHHPFVRRPLRAEGQWVVVPFELNSHPQTGSQS